MQVPDEIRRCVVFLGYLNQKTGDYETVGTAFLFGRSIDNLSALPYLVTAAHVIRELAKRGVTETQVRVNTAGGQARWLPLPIGSWKFHPSRSEVDVAMALAQDLKGAGGRQLYLSQPTLENSSIIEDHRTIPEDLMINREIIESEAIGVGDEVFVTGLFQPHSGRERNVPIVRVGNLAAMNDEPVTTKVGRFPAYLIEARSIGGLSGSPVFVYLGLWRRKGTEVGHPAKSPWYLIGLIQGHFDVREAELDKAMPESEREARVNMGIAIVVPWFEIMEVWKQPCFQKVEVSLDQSREGRRLRESQIAELKKHAANLPRYSTLGEVELVFESESLEIER